MPLHKGDCGCRTLHDILHFPAGILGDKCLGINIEGVPVAFLDHIGHTCFHRDFLPDDYVVAEPYGHAYRETENHLGQELDLGMQAFLVLFEHLDIVISETESSAPQCREKKKLEIDIGKVAEQQHRNDYRDDNDDSTHCRGAFLLHLALESEIPDCLSDLLSLKPGDNPFTDEEGDKHRGDAGQHSPEGQVGEKPLSGDVVTLEILEQVVYHYKLLFFNCFH